MPNQTGSNRTDAFVESLKRALEGFAAHAGRYVREGNRRQVAFRDKDDRTLFQLPLTLIVLASLLLVVAGGAPLLVIAVVGALVLGYQFVVTKEEGPS